LWLKLAYTAFLLVLVPVYYVHYGLLHFLWFSDVALFVTLLALWRESPLLTGMMAVGVLPLELGWNLDFFIELATGWAPIGGASYMFDAALPLYLRLLSLFHVALPLIWIWLLFRIGYDGRAYKYQLLLFWTVVVATYTLTDPQDNINWVFGAAALGMDRLSQTVYLALYMALPPALLFLPLHKLYLRYFGSRAVAVGASEC
jgi:hypothetical protein